MRDLPTSASAGADPVAEALRSLSEQFSVSRQEWRNLHRGGDGMLDALVSHGYALERDGRFAVSAVGRARLADVEPEGVDG